MKKFIKVSLAELKGYMSDSAIIEPEDREHVLNMMESIVSCINGRPHGSFISAITSGDLVKAKGVADMQNVKYIKFYSIFAKAFSQIAPSLIEALVLGNTVYLEPIKLQNEDLDAKVDERWDVYISEVQKPFARLLMWKTASDTGTVMGYKLNMIAPSTKCFSIVLDPSQVMIPKP